MFVKKAHHISDTAYTHSGASSIVVARRANNPHLFSPSTQSAPGAHRTTKTMEELRTLPEYLKASNADGTVILQATATWCSQCKAIAPFVEKLVKQFPEAKFYKYDTDSAGDIAQELGVSQMPVFTIFQNGDLEETVTGARGKALEETIRKVYKGEVRQGDGE